MIAGKGAIWAAVFTLAMLAIGCGGGGGGGVGAPNGGNTSGGSTNNGGSDTGGSTDTGGLPGSTATLAYVADGSGFPRVYSVSAGGSATVVDTDALDPDSVALDAAGSTVVFSAPALCWQVYKMPLACGTPVALTPEDSDALWPSISPDGTQVIYTSNAAGISQIYMVPMAGGAPVQLTNLANGALKGAYSPDGSKIVFVAGDASDDIWIMNADGTNAAPLMVTPANESEPCFSPDGTSIVYVADAGGVDYNGQLWVMGVDGSNATQITSSMQNDQNPCFATDGSLYFTREAGASRDVYRIAPGGSAAAVVTGAGFVYDVAAR